MGSPVHDEVLQFQADHEWIDQHRETLHARYPEQWIAVQNGRVIASDIELNGLLAKLPDPAHTCVEFLGGEPVEMAVAFGGSRPHPSDSFCIGTGSYQPVPTHL